MLGSIRANEHDLFRRVSMMLEPAASLVHLRTLSAHYRRPDDARRGDNRSQHEQRAKAELAWHF
jgi:hypothetical protein